MRILKWAVAAGVGLVCGLTADVAGAQNAPLPQLPYSQNVQTFFRRVGIGGVVANAPYSADVVSTVTQVLSDGTRIEQSVTGKVYRDNAGRMRREQQVLGLATLAPGTSPVTIVTITDPTTRTTYTINDQARTATRAPYAQVLQWNTPQWITPFGRGVVNWVADPTGPQGLVALRLRTDAYASAIALDGQLRLNGQPVAPGLGPDTAPPGARQGGGRGARTGGPATAAPSATPTGGGQESLGTRQMEGVNAAGTRVTQTIPVGQIGNDRPIVITDETWESPELQVAVYSKHHDPRSGDVEYRLRNISRTEPPATLFQVPAGYTVTDPLVGGPGGRTGGGRGGAPGAPGTRPPGQ